MAGVHVLGDRIKRYCGGFDLVDHHSTVFIGKNTIGPAFQRERDTVNLMVGGKRYFGFVAFTGSLLQFAVDARTFQRTVKAGESAVDAAGAQQKLHQLPDGQTDICQSISPPFKSYYVSPNISMHSAAASSTLPKSTAAR